MKTYKLIEQGYIQNPETEKKEDIFEVNVWEGDLTVHLPHLQDYIKALNEAKEYKEKYTNLLSKWEKITPTLQKHKTVFETLLNSLKGSSRGMSREDLFMRELIQDIEKLLSK